jgi:hypothetical protein
MNHQLPAYLPEAALPMYYRGIGRSLWYKSNADVVKVPGRIEGFPSHRHPDLWRGVGIAVAYVGGCDDNTLKQLFQLSGTNGIQLASGAALAVRSRKEAGSVTTDTDRCCRVWYTLIMNEQMANTDAPEKEDAYLNWIMLVEEGSIEQF